MVFLKSWPSHKRAEERAKEIGAKNIEKLID